MKIPARLLFVFLTSLSLIGCTYFDTGEHMDVSGRLPAQVIDLTQKQGLENWPVQGSATQPLPSVENMISDSSEGRVEMFSLDSPGLAVKEASGPPAAITAATLPADKDSDIGMQIEKVEAVPIDPAPFSMISFDPSVEIFPLDDSMRRALPAQQPSPAPVPKPAADISLSPALRPPEKFNLVNARNGKKAIVYFDHDSDVLDEEDQRIVSDVADRQRKKSDAISVEGFASAESSITDPVQRKIVNLKMSMDRALSVARALMQQGIPAELITAVAYGETRTGETPAESRRVEISGFSEQ